jgi:hypothetical protein
MKADYEIYDFRLNWDWGLADECRYDVKFRIKYENIDIYNDVENTFSRWEKDGLVRWFCNFIIEIKDKEIINQLENLHQKRIKENETTI